MNFFKIDEFDSADGSGIRVGLYVSGCTHKCKGCYSSEYWDFESGEKFTEKHLTQLQVALTKDYIEGLSILGGDPLENKNIFEVKYIIEQCKHFYEKSYNKPLNIWLWTGSTFEDLCLLLHGCLLYDKIWKDSISARQYVNDLKYIFNNIDVLVDGPFIEEKKNLNLAFRGSSNQRLIDMKKTLKNKKVTLLDIKENMRHG